MQDFSLQNSSAWPVIIFQGSVGAIANLYVAESVLIPHILAKARWSIAGFTFRFHILWHEANSTFGKQGCKIWLFLGPLKLKCQVLCHFLLELFFVTFHEVPPFWNRSSNICFWKDCMVWSLWHEFYLFHSSCALVLNWLWDSSWDCLFHLVAAA